MTTQYDYGRNNYGSSGAAPGAAPGYDPGYDRDREIREALAAGRRAQASLAEAESSLRSARGWGLFDIFGGGLIATLAKHSRLGDANEELECARRDLRIFAQELRDVRGIRFEQLRVDVGDFLALADYLFDGPFADIMVQSRIDEALTRVSEAQRLTTALLAELTAELGGRE